MRAGLLLAASAMVAAAAATAAAQELEPRAYSPSPIGTTFVVVSATRTGGGVFTDPSVPIDDVEATVGVLGLAAGRTFGIAGKQTLVLGAVPVTWGTASGQVGEDRREVSRRGLADPRVRVSMILAGSPAMTRADFAKSKRGTLVGASMTVGLPLGQYDNTKLVNLGSNRWSFKPEVGVSYPRGRWTIEGSAGAWIFTDNDHYFPGESTRHQDLVGGFQGHLSYTLGRRAWLAVNATWYTGGRSSINGVAKADLQRNTRLGATWAQPIGRRQSIKVSYSAGATTRTGADFRTITAAWQVVIF